MKRTILRVLLVGFLLLSLFSSACLQPEAPGPEGKEPASPSAQVQPATPVAVKQLTILESSVKPEFPAQLTFSLRAGSDANITDVRLHYTLDRESFANVTGEVYLDFSPNTTISTQWVWDMRKTGGLPTGAGVEYWWTVKDINGNKVETTRASIIFDDNRYAWKGLTENNVTIYWYQGNQSFAGAIMAAAQEALTRLSDSTGANLKKPVKIYIYASRDLLGAMIFPQEWTGGVTFPEYGIIIIGIDPSSLDWGKRATAHELTHLVVHQMIFNPYSDLPTWLDEGLAKYNEGDLEDSFIRSIKMAIDTNSLISVRSLASPFSANTDEAILSYAQSYSLVELLVTTRGQSKMLELLTTFSLGSGYDDALKKVYDFDMDGLNTLWREYVIKRYQEKQGKTVALPPALIRVVSEMTASLVLDRRLASQSGVGR